VDRRVVDQHVELVDLGSQRVDRRLLGDVEKDFTRNRIARAREHRVAAPGELARDLAAEAAVGAGDERSGHDPIVHFGTRAPLTAARVPKCTPGTTAS
jgi:hypothetical protein